MNENKKTDREKLIELLNEFFDGEEDGGFVLYFTDSECEIIADYLLSHGVTFEKQGEWETDKEDLDWGNSLKRKHCTNCGKRPHFDREKREFILSDYCPNCGARMTKNENP